MNCNIGFFVLLSVLLSLWSLCKCCISAFNVSINYSQIFACGCAVGPVRVLLPSRSGVPRVVRPLRQLKWFEINCVVCISSMSQNLPSLYEENWCIKAMLHYGQFVVELWTFFATCSGVNNCEVKSVESVAVRSANGFHYSDGSHGMRPCL